MAKLQVVDLDGVGVTLGLYTQEQLEAMNYVVKEYDECWISTLVKINELGVVNAAPAKILNGMYLRAKYYAKDASKTNIRLWVDYKISLKSGDGID